MSSGYYFSSRCKVCKSPHIVEYHKLWLEDKFPFEKLSDYALTLNEKTSRESFRTHMTKHLSPYIKNVKQVETGKFTSQYVQNKLEEEQDIVTAIQTKLSDLSKVIGRMMDDPDLDKDMNKLKVLKEMSSEIRLTQEAYLRIRQRYLKETVSDGSKMYGDFKNAIEGCCPTCLIKILERLEHMGYV